MKHIKTYEGLFNLFKKDKKKKIYQDDIWSCFLDIIDESRIKTSLRDEWCGDIFTSYEDVFKTKHFNNLILTGKENLKYKNMIAYKMIYNPSQISDEEVSKIIEQCRKKLDIYDCKLSLFIGQGNDSGWTSKNEYSDLEGVLGAYQKTWSRSF
jgi:hypothetical protein